MTAPAPLVLVVDDQPIARESLQIVAGVVAGGYAVTFYAIRATGFAVGPL